MSEVDPKAGDKARQKAFKVAPDSHWACSRRDVLRVGAISAVGLALCGRAFPESDSVVAGTGGSGLPQSAGPLRSAGVLACSWFSDKYSRRARVRNKCVLPCRKYVYSA